MSVQSDFNYIPVNHTFTATSPLAERTFNIETSPVGFPLVLDDGYLLITVRSVSMDGHRIQINGTDLTGFDIPLPPGGSGAWFTYMDRIQTGLLHAGMNNIKIIRTGNDDFVVKDIVVHWRETPG